MSNIQVIFYHPDISAISDKTLRDFLKSIGKIARQTQRRELYYVLRQFNLSDGQEQSIKDRLRSKIDHAPVYYVNTISDGSLTANITWGAFFLWLLQSTIGETVKDSWKNIEIHKTIIEYVKSDRTGRIVQAIEEEFGHQEPNLGRLFVKSVNVENNKKSCEIIVTLATKSSEKIEIDTLIDDRYVLDFGDDILNELLDQMPK